MDLSWRARTAIAALGLMGIGGWLVVVDLGISAGRVHHGVTVSGVDLGGLTPAEAEDLLKVRQAELESAPVTFVADGFNDSFAPSELGWDGRPASTVESAMRIGREGAPFGALADRARAWTGGIEVEWAGRPKHRKVSRLIDYWEEQLTALGYEVDRWRLRQRIKRAIVVWPRRPFPFPVDA